MTPKAKTEDTMIGYMDVKVQAHNPDFPLEPVYVFVNSAQSFRIKNVPKRIGKWDITNVYVNVSYPDNTTVSKECVPNGCVWVGTVNGCSTSGTSTNGFVVTASGIDEDGNTVTNYVLGAGDLYVKNLDGTISPETTAARMYFYDATPTSPNNGDVVFISGVMNVWDGTEWKPCAKDALTDVQISAIDSVVDERATVVKYLDGTISSFNIVGELGANSIPNKINAVEVKIGSSVTSIGNQAFQYCSSLTSVTIPDNVTSIGNQAFQYCSGLTSVIIGNGVTSIRYGVFDNCTSLTSVKIPNGVTSIEGSAFAFCTSLTSITIPDGVTSIGSYAFYSCYDLSSITIPNSVTSIGSSAFEDCSELTSVVFYGKTLEQVQNIEDGSGNKYYPWGIFNTSIITTWNDASKEWVEGQGYLSSIPSTYKTYADTVSSLSGDGYVTTTQLAEKRDILDMDVRGLPTGEGSWFMVNDVKLAWNGNGWGNYQTQGMEIYYLPESPDSYDMVIGENEFYVYLNSQYTSTKTIGVDTYEIVGYAGVLATDSWVKEQNYLSAVPNTYKTYADTVSSLSGDGYATQTWVGQQGYITSSYPVKNDGGVANAKAMTQQAYDALQTKDATTLYVITEN